MSEDALPIDITKLKITSNLSLIGILVGFGITIGVNLTSFRNMKNKLSDLSETINSLETKLSKKIEQQNFEFNTQVRKIENSSSRMEGKMEAYFEKINSK